MEVSITKTITPEQDELKKKKKTLHKLEADLAQRELDLATLSGELKALELLYMRRVGMRLAHLDLIDARITEILARMNPDDSTVEKKAEKARRKAEKANQKAKAAQDAPEECTRFRPSESLKSLYREVAKRIHPDLATDEESRNLRNQWMVSVNAAYQDGDEEKLRSLLEEWENSPESVQGSGYHADLERTLRKINQAKERIREIKADFDRLKSTFAYSLRIRIELAQREGRDLLEEMAQRIEKQILRKQGLLDELLKNSPVNTAEW